MKILLAARRLARHIGAGAGSTPQSIPEVASSGCRAGACIRIVDRERDGVHIVSVSGDLDLRSSIELRGALLDLLARDVSSILIDLHGLKSIDSSAIATLLECARGLTRRRGFLALFGAAQRVGSWLEVLRVDHLLRIFSCEDEAVGAALGMRRSTASRLKHSPISGSGDGTWPRRGNTA